MTSIKLTGCTVEAELAKPYGRHATYNLKILDSKGNTVISEEGADLGGYTNLEWRLIRSLPEPERAQYRKEISRLRAYERRMLSDAPTK